MERKQCSTTFVCLHCGSEGARSCSRRFGDPSPINARTSANHKGLPLTEGGFIALLLLGSLCAVHSLLEVSGPLGARVDSTPHTVPRDTDYICVTGSRSSELIYASRQCQKEHSATNDVKTALRIGHSGQNIPYFGKSREYCGRYSAYSPKKRYSWCNFPTTEVCRQQTVRF